MGRQAGSELAARNSNYYYAALPILPLAHEKRSNATTDASNHLRSDSQPQAEAGGAASAQAVEEEVQLLILPWRLDQQRLGLLRRLQARRSTKCE